jgi:hypothetical protein
LVIAAKHSPVTALVRPQPAVTHADANFASHARIAIGGIGRGLLVAHVNQLDFMVAQLRQDGEQMSAIDSETIARAIFVHDPRD